MQADSLPAEIHIYYYGGFLKVICFDFFFWGDVDQFLKVFIACVTILLPFHVLVLFSCFWLLGMWDLSSLPGIELKTPALEGEV